MGGFISKDWNEKSIYYTKFFISLFGRPSTYLLKSGGFLLWTTDVLKNKSLFHQKVGFNKIIVIDDELPIILCFKFPLSLEKEQALLSLNNVEFNRHEQLICVRGKCFNSAICLANDTLNFLSSGQTTTRSETSLDEAKQCYSSFMKNLAASTPIERFNDEPWYVDQPYSTNLPWNIDANDKDSRNYYRSLEDIMKIKKDAMRIKAYPRAPSGKASIENFFGLPQMQKEKFIAFDAYQNQSKDPFVKKNFP
jgi:hypothetical protein